MPAQALYSKWRPRRFDDVIGQEHITATLRSALVQNRIRHAYLFNGPRGTGKTTMARLLAKAINCEYPDPAERPCDECAHCIAINEGRYLDLLEIDAASYNSVDDVRELRDKIAFAPSEGNYKIYIVDEVHRFSAAAFDALLKTLEEPPEHTIFILATTELDKVPATIKSRSITFEFRRVSIQQVADRLQLIADYEGMKIDRDVLEVIAQHGSGSVRDSISLLDQLVVDLNEHITMDMAEQVLGTAGNRYVGKLVQAIIDSNAALGLELLNQAINEGADPAQFGRQIVDYLRNLLVAQTAGPKLLDTTNEARQAFAEQSAGISRGALIRAIRAFNTAVNEVRRGWQPQLPLELALVESTRPVQEEVIVTRPAPAAVTQQPSAPVAHAEPTGGDPAASASVPDQPDVESLSFKELVTGWPQVLGLMRQYEDFIPLVKQLERTRLHALNGKTLTMVVDNNTLKYSLQKKEKVIIRAVKRILNYTVSLKILVASDLQQQLSAAVDEDPLVRDIMDEHPSHISSIEDTQEGV